MIPAIVGARTSTFSDKKVSHEAQLDTARKWADTNGCEVVGTFEDLGVSATVAPQNRPDLGQWLTPEGSAQWQAIVFSKMDRAFRSTRHCVDFARWAEEHHKLVVFAEDGLALDYRPGNAKGIDGMLAELFVYIGSFFAEMELNRFQTRAKDGHRVLRSTNRWASGLPAFGYRVVEHPAGKGKGLEPDPESQKVLHDMAAKLLDGWSFTSIAEWLNDQQVLTQRDRARIAKGEQPTRKPWSVTTVIDALTSPKTQGVKMHRGEPVLDPLGVPIRLAEPTFDPDLWNRIQSVSQSRRMARSRTHSTNPMLGVGYCGKCGSSLAQQFTRGYRYYRCSRTPKNCLNVFIQADEADGILEETFLRSYGHKPQLRRVFQTGSDNAHELHTVNKSIDRLRRESDAGLIVTAEDEEVYLARLKSLIERKNALESQPVQKPGWVVEETGKTYAEAWEETEDKPRLLKESGIRWELHSGKPRIEKLFVPDDMKPINTKTPQP